MAEEFLRSGEYVVARGRAKIKSPYSWEGEMVLTNLRIMFLSSDYSFYIPLEEIEDVWVDGGLLSKKLHVETDKKEYIVCVSKASKWVEKIDTCRDRLRQAMRYLLGVPT